MKYSNIIWDWNGTLLDDVNTALRSVNIMLKKREMFPINLEEYYRYIGTPIRGFYEKVFDLDKENYDLILAEYHRTYADLLSETNLASGASKMLEKAKELRISQTLLSSSEHKQLISQVRHFGLIDYFDHILGASDFLAAGKTSRVKEFIKNQNLESDKLLVVGDLAQDYEMSKAVGASCVLLAAGHQSKEQLLSTGALVIDKLEELFPILI